MTIDERDAEARVVVTEPHAGLAVIRLNRPAEKNQLSIATLTELDVAFNALVLRPEIAAVIFTGTLDVFASGASIRELRQLSTETARDFARRGQSLFQKIADAAPLTIAAVNGYCMGGGLDMALACDLRCASTNAVFAHPGARLGIITGWGGTQRLPRLIGAARALEMFTTGRRVHAEEAVLFGLITRTADPVLDVAFEMAQSYLNARVRKTQTA